VLNWRPSIDFKGLVSMMLKAQIGFIQGSAPLAQRDNDRRSVER
jgi:hypothetical protein